MESKFSQWPAIRSRILNSLRVGFALSLVLFALGFSKTVTAAGHELPRMTISVVPQFTAVNIASTWMPLLERISRLAGIAFELRHYSSIREFEEGFLRGDTDFAYMNPYHAVMAKRAQGYIPLLRNTEPLRGILVVRKNSEIQSVKELSGKRLAFPSPNAFGASLWMRAFLEKDGITYTPSYVQTHQNVFRSVLLGATVAGGAIRSTLAREPAEVRSQLRVLFETPPVASHPLGFHPRVSAALRDRIVAIMLSMDRDSVDQKLLAAVGLKSLVEADYKHDYEPLEGFNLQHEVAEQPTK